MDEPVWVLRPINNEEREERDERDPWDPWYDKTFGYVVRAMTEEEARETAQDHGFGGESAYGVWTDSSWTTCVPIEEAIADEVGVIMEDFRSA